MGISGSSNTAVSNKPKTGVYGHAVQDGGSRGVWGHSVQGTGVHGDSSSNYGVRGVSSSGVGVSGLSGSGVGVRAESSGGLALLVNGRVAFGSASGRAVIAAGTNKVKVSPGFSVSRSSILATLMGDAGGSKTVKRVAIGSPATSFTIFLTGNAAADVTVAWLVISPSP